MAAIEICDAQDHRDVAYKNGSGFSDYELERCKLDIYLPKNANGFATLVWFHGGGLKNGDKTDLDVPAIAAEFARKDIALVSVNYRLSPKAAFPAYIEDAAASVAWTHQNIKSHGGDPSKIFVSGHSAGGYLAAMAGMDERYLNAHGLSVSQIAGFLPVSGQMITHSTVREERGIPKNRALIDKAAPLFYVRDDTPPFLNICGSEDLPGRAAENHLFAEFMTDAGNPSADCVEFEGRDHVNLVSKMPETNDPVRVKMIEFILKNAGMR